MERSINIDDIGFRNLKKNNDLTQCKYDDTKMDKAGEKCSNNNLHGHPKNPNMCLFLSLGTHMSMSSDSLRRNFFLLVCVGSKIGTAAKRFVELLSKLSDY